LGANRQNERRLYSHRAVNRRDRRAASHHRHFGDRNKKPRDREKEHEQRAAEPQESFGFGQFQGFELEHIRMGIATAPDGAQRRGYS
jgi:hypothetical protein